MLTLDLEPAVDPPGPSTGRQVGAWRDETGGICARLFTDGRRRWIDWPRLGVFAFEPPAMSVQAWPAPAARREVITETFRRILQPAILQALGWQALHASAVVGADGLMAFCGVAHSGKSTLAYALSEAGLVQWADDAVVFHLEGDTAVADAVPFLPRLRPASRQFFERPAPTETPVRNSVSTPSTCRIAALYVLKQDASFERRHRLSRIPPAQAFAQVLPHAHCFDQSDVDETRRITQDYLETVSRVPVFALTYRPGLDRLSELLELVTQSRVGSVWDRMAVLQ